jgi:AcrR family transcriptional regulator
MKAKSQAKGDSGAQARPSVMRRRPTQQRSRTAVDAMLRAAEAIIDRDGLEGLSTRSVAEMAGVSIGSVYGYFPNKETIIFELGNAWMDDILTIYHVQQPENRPAASVTAYYDYIQAECAKRYSDKPTLAAIIDVLNTMPELRDAALQHLEKVVALDVRAISALLPTVPKEEIDSVCHYIAAILHAVLTNAFVWKRLSERDAMRHLRLTINALLLQLQMAQQPAELAPD